jgi:hypothetical protein
VGRGVIKGGQRRDKAGRTTFLIVHGAACGESVQYVQYLLGSASVIVMSSIFLIRGSCLQRW